METTIVYFFSLTAVFGGLFSEALATGFRLAVELERAMEDVVVEAVVVVLVVLVVLVVVVAAVGAGLAGWAYSETIQTT